MKNKIGLIVILFTVIGFSVIAISQNNRINTLSEDINTASDTIVLLNASINIINNNINSQEKKIDSLYSSVNNIDNSINSQKKEIETIVSSINKLTNGEIQNFGYNLYEYEKRIYKLENIVKSLPDVELKTAYIKQIKEENDQIIITLDFVELFWGDEATKASQEDGFMGVYEDHGCYTRNNDLSEELFPVSKSFILYGDDHAGGTSITDLIANEALGGNNYYRIFNVILIDNKIIVIEEQYIS